MPTRGTPRHPWRSLRRCTSWSHVEHPLLLAEPCRASGAHLGAMLRSEAQVPSFSSFPSSLSWPPWGGPRWKQEMLRNRPETAISPRDGFSRPDPGGRAPWGGPRWEQEMLTERPETAIWPTEGISRPAQVGAGIRDLGVVSWLRLPPAVRFRVFLGLTFKSRQASPRCCHSRMSGGGLKPP